MKKILLIISIALIVVPMSSCGVKGKLTHEKQGDITGQNNVAGQKNITKEAISEPKTAGK